jgi:peptidoglycan/xylan/chitin deacetylase (PgdA/CDA1 family)
MVHRTPFFLPLLYSSLTWRVATQKKELFLTFDDGPVSGPTEFVLEALQKFNAKATFFCIGENIQKHGLVFKQIIDNGHAVGNHTHNHLNGWRTKTLDYIENVKLCQHQIENYIPMGSSGLRNMLFRPPYGQISRRQITSLSAFTIIMWDVLSIDYNKNLSAQKCLANTIAATRPGSIIVFHDSYKAEKNLTYALPRLLDHFSSLGFAFNSIT